MLYIRIELHPRGDKTKARVIGEGYIANDGTTDTPLFGNYAAKIPADDGVEVVADGEGLVVRLQKSPEYAKAPSVWKRGLVRDFPRQKLGPWDLLFRCLRAVVGARNAEEAT